MKTTILVPVVAMAGLLCLLVFAGPAQAYADELPSRVARLSLLEGNQVSVALAGQEGWSNARLNWPLRSGDRLYTGEGSRSVVEMTGADLRIGEDSAVSLLALERERVQISLTQGTVNLAVRRMDMDDIFEIDMPGFAFVADRVGEYRIDVDPDGIGAIITVFSGAGTVWDAYGQSRQVNRGRSYHVVGHDVADLRPGAIPARNAFDRFCNELDSRRRHAEPNRYVSRTVIGYTDLDYYGTWQTSATYGHIWFPSGVSVDWAPYRHGRWAWIDPWGWTWIDNAPWGFAPFHYGRWAMVSGRWGWVPGPRMHRAVYAPALVAFLGNVSIRIGGSMPVVWFPLGPRDVYRPPYAVTENYFININLGSGRFFHRHGMRAHWRHYHDHRRGHYDDYAYRHNARAMTAATRGDFRQSRLIRHSAADLRAAVLQKAEFTTSPRLQPDRAARVDAMPRARPQHQAFQRPVLTHTPLRRSATSDRTPVTRTARQRPAASVERPRRQAVIDKPAARNPIASSRSHRPARAPVRPAAPTHPRGTMSPSAEVVPQPAPARRMQRPEPEARPRPLPARNEPTRREQPAVRPQPIQRQMPRQAPEARPQPQAAPRAHPPMRRSSGGFSRQARPAASRPPPSRQAQPAQQETRTVKRAAQQHGNGPRGRPARSIDD